MQPHYNPTDVIKVDVPLFIRLLEFAREDAKTDLDLHVATENILSMSEEGKTLTMDDYDAIVKDSNGQDVRATVAKMNKPAIGESKIKNKQIKTQINEIKRMKQLAGLIID
jgi:hypothetical protein